MRRVSREAGPTPLARCPSWRPPIRAASAPGSIILSLHPCADRHSLRVPFPRLHELGAPPGGLSSERWILLYPDPPLTAIRRACPLPRFYYAGQNFVDRGYGEDAREKYFGGDKPELAKKNPLINLPYVVDGETVVTQSNSVLIYLGKKLGIDKDEYFIHNHQVSALPARHGHLCVIRLRAAQPSNVWASTCVWRRSLPAPRRRLAATVVSQQHYTGGLRRSQHSHVALVRGFYVGGSRLRLRYRRLRTPHTPRRS